MDEQNVYGIKYEVDIEELKTSTAEASKKIKMANAEFNEASSSMENWSTSVDGVSAKIKQLNTILEAERSKLARSKQEYNSTVDTINKYQQSIDELKAEKQKAIEQYGEESDEVKQLNYEISKLERQQTQAMNSADKLKVSISNQQAAVNRTERSISSYETQLAEVQEAQQRAEKSGRSLEEELDDLRNASNQVEEATEKMGDGFTITGGVISGLITGAIQTGISKIGEFASSILTLSEATEEYRTMMAKVEGSASSFGYSIDFAKQQYQDFYAYLKDDQMATNAITNLMGMKVSTKSVTNAANAAIAVWTAYGDSIPIEGLTESINETAQVREVTGSLADALNWAGISEDQFNEKLAATNSTQEAADLIASTLNKTYGKSKTTYDSLTGSITDANRAEAELKETQAELGETLQPLNTEFTKLKTKALKSMAPMVEDVADEFMGLLNDIDWDDAADSINDLLEGAADGLSFVMKNIDPIAAGVKGLATAWGIYKTAQLGANAVTKTTNTITALTTAATKASTVATVANTTATEGATIATKALAAAQKLTPWGLVAGLVAGAAVGLVSWAQSAAEARRKADENAVATDEMTEKYKDLTESVQQSKQAWDDRVQSTEAQVASADILAKKLDELSQKENKTNSEKAQMKYYVEQLNELIPDLNLKYDEEKDALNKSSEAIRKNIEMQKQLALAKAAQERMTEIAKEMADAELELAEATDQHMKNQYALNEAQKEFNKAQQEWIDGGSQMSGELYQAYTKAANAVADAQINMDKSRETVIGYKDTVKELNKEFDAMDEFAQKSVNAAELEEQLSAIVEMAREKGYQVGPEIAEGIRAGKYAVPQSIEELQALISFASIEKKAEDSGIKVPQYLADGISSGSIKPVEAVKQMNSYVLFTDLLQKVEKAGFDVPEDLSKKVQEGKMKPATAVQQMNNLISFNDLLQKSSAAGQKVPQNIQQAVLNGKMSPAEAVEEMNRLMVKEAEKSKQPMGKAGSAAGAEYAKEVDKKKTDAKTAGEKLNEKAKEGAGSDDLYDEGKNAGQGFIDGIGSLVENVKNAAVRFVQNAIEAAKNAQDSHSLSRIWEDELGEMAGEGYAIGLDNSRQKVNKSVKGLINSAAETMADGINGERYAISDMLDMNSMKASLSASAGTLRGRVSGVRETEMAAAGGNVVNNVTMNQYNTSPKALDSLEIYRNSKKQEKQLKAWMDRKGARK